MGIKKISELTELSLINNDDLIPVVDSKNGETKKALMSSLFNGLIQKNAGSHNGIYRGKDITDLFYNGTL